MRPEVASSAQWLRAHSVCERTVASSGFERPVAVSIAPVAPEQLFRAPSGSGAVVSNAPVAPEQLFRAHSGAGASCFERLVALGQLFRTPQWLRSSCFERTVAPEQLFRAPSGSGAAASSAPVAPEQLFRAPQWLRAHLRSVFERPSGSECTGAVFSSVFGVFEPASAKL